MITNDSERVTPVSVAGTVDSRQVPDLVGDLDLVGEPDMSSLASPRFLSPRFVIFVILMTIHPSAEGIAISIYLRY